jgi:hypothetical protein
MALMRLFVPGLLFAVLAFASGGLAAPKGFPTAGPIRFLAFGDSGTGSSSQLAVAKAMEAVCKERGCQFALDAGDNIYEYGPSSEDDPQFQTKFEKPYARLNFPFFMALGNHDESGLAAGSGVHPRKGEYEIQYTKKSSRWMLPSRYYRFAAPVKKADDYESRAAEPILELFAIDTNPLAPQNMPVHSWYEVGGKFDLEQRAWLKEGLASSKASWKIVMGHHPYRNNGKHGNAGNYEGIGKAVGRELKKMFEQTICGKADLLITGHDHSLQWLKAHAECGSRPQFIISGASAKSNGRGNTETIEQNPAVWESFETLGFFWIEATKEKLKILAFTTDNEGRPVLAHEGKIIHGGETIK